MLALHNDRIKDRFKAAGIRPIGDTKEAFEHNLSGALERGDVEYAQLVSWLDEVDPWRKQQVFLYGGRVQGVGNWRDIGHLRGRLAGTAHAACLNATVPVVLPAALTIASIRHTPAGLSVLGYVRREHRLREPDMDTEEVQPDGRKIIWHAFHEFMVRTAVVFEWDFLTNSAMVRITQLPATESYEEARDALFSSIRGWFNVVHEFPVLSLRRSIGALHKHEASGGTEVQAYLMAYDTAGGRHFEGRGGSGDQPFLGEAVSDDAMQRVRDAGVGRSGNFHWLPGKGRPITNRVHALINAHANRVRFYVDLDEVSIRYVLARIRHYSR